MALALDTELSTYEAMKQELESHSMGKWVVLYDQKLIAVHESFEDAAEDAVKRFGRGPYLIRQVGAPPVTLPASVMYHPDHW
jgi:hypothetical protein